MLKELKLSNFRLFDDQVTIRFRPITVLIGKNNSGKSSIIKFLHMLKQSLNRESPHFFNTKNTQLGDFESLKNCLTKKENLFFELTTEIRRSELLFALKQKQYAKKYLRDNQEIKDTELYTKATVETSYKDIKKTINHEVSLLYKNTIQPIVGGRKDESHFLSFEKELKEIPEDDWAEKKIKKDCIKSVHDNIRSLYHLLPVRGNEENIIVSQEPPVINVNKDGKYTLPHLLKMQENNTSAYDFILSHIQKVLDVEKINFTDKSESVAKCFAKYKTTGAEVLIQNLGFGVSQCLPIFVQGALMPRFSSLMVEQPEAQLHPTAQLALGSFFADLWKEQKTGSIIETHSDNILLRLRRLVAKGELTPQDVSVAFCDFDTDKGQVVVKNLDIENDGSMEAGLPMEFFGENVKEVLKIGAGE